MHQIRLNSMLFQSLSTCSFYCTYSCCDTVVRSIIIIIIAYTCSPISNMFTEVKGELYERDTSNLHLFSDISPLSNLDLCNVNLG